MQMCISLIHWTFAAVLLQELCEESQEAKELFDRAAEILGYDLLSLCVQGALETPQYCIFPTKPAGSIEPMRRKSSIIPDHYCFVLSGRLEGC
jgi:hypothetical protein